jgi:hypothetical protein
MSIVVDTAREMVGYFTTVAFADPVSAVLLALGALLTAVAVAVFGGLALGGVVAPFTGGKY